MKKVINRITSITIHLSKNKKEDIEKNFSREYSNSLDEYLKSELQKYRNIDVVIMNRPKERK